MAKLLVLNEEEKERGLYFLKSQLGKPYNFGTEVPERYFKEKKFEKILNFPSWDCSELVQCFFFYATKGKFLPVDGSYNQYKESKQVNKYATGDLVFLQNSANGQIYHVGILAGKNLRTLDWEIIEAKGKKHGVIKTTLKEWEKKKEFTKEIKRLIV